MPAVEYERAVRRRSPGQSARLGLICIAVRVFIGNAMEMTDKEQRDYIDKHKHRIVNDWEYIDFRNAPKGMTTTRALRVLMKDIVCWVKYGTKRGK